jgi:hypothetical protein
MAETEPHAQVEQHGAFHLPPPSIWPPVLAVGIAVLLIGIVLNLAIAIIGAVVSVAAVVLWVRDARHEFTELPD